MTSPSVSVLIPTYARTELLAEAIESCLRQELAPSEILVVNDCPWQQLSCPGHPTVRIVNLPARLPLGEKRNVLLDLAIGEYITFLDDDDLIMPWHLSQLNLNAPVNFPKHWFRFTAGDRWGWEPILGGIVVAARRGIANAVRFAETLYVGEDNAFRGRLEQLYGRDAARPHAPSYVYRTARGSGISRFTDGSGAPQPERFAEDAAARMRAGSEPTGAVEIRPRWREDYWRAVATMFPRDVPAYPASGILA